MTSTKEKLWCDVYCIYSKGGYTSAMCKEKADEAVKLFVESYTNGSLL